MQQSVPMENWEASAPQRRSASIRLCSLMCASPPELHLSGNTTVRLIAGGKLWELGVYSAGLTNSLKCFHLQGANECYFGKKTLKTFQEESIFCSWEKSVNAKERCCKEHNYTWPVNGKWWNGKVCAWSHCWFLGLSWEPHCAWGPTYSVQNYPGAICSAMWGCEFEHLFNVCLQMALTHNVVTTIKSLQVCEFITTA